MSARAAFTLAVAFLVWAPSGADAQTAADSYYQFLMARRLEGQGDLEGALAALTRAAAADRGSAEIRAEIAAFHLRHNRRDEAERAANEALAVDSGNLEARRVLGMILAANSDAAADKRQSAQAVGAASAAIAHLEQVVSAPSADINLHYTLGRMYLRAGQSDKAVQALGRVVSQNPNSLQARLVLSQAYIAANNLNAAIDTLAEIVDDEPRIASTLGQYQEQAGRLREAVESYTKALTAAPMSREIKFRRVAALYSLKNYQDAARFAAQAQQEHPEDTRFARVQARALFDGGDADRAVSVLESALRSSPRDTQVQFALADLYNDVNRTPDAVRMLRQLIERDPENHEALNYLAYMLADRGEQLDEAIQLVQRALAAEPGNPSYLDSLGWAHFRRGELGEAEKYLTPAAEKLPRNSVVLDHLGEVYARRGRWADAISAWTRALAGDGQVSRDVLERKIRDARSKLTP